MDPNLRSKLLHAVERYPGLHLRELQRRVGCSPMLAEYHLNFLEKLDLIQSRAQGGYRHFFPLFEEMPNVSDLEKTWLGLLRRPPVLAISLTLLEVGSIRVGELAKQLELPPSTAGYHVKSMVEAELAGQESVLGATQISLINAPRVLELLKAFHPTPELAHEYAELWGSVFRRSAPAPSLEEDPIEEVLPDQVRALNRSAQEVYLSLSRGMKTQKELCQSTSLARRTVYAALKKLDAENLLVSHVHLRDTRQTRYALREVPDDS